MGSEYVCLYICIDNLANDFHFYPECKQVPLANGAGLDR